MKPANIFTDKMVLQRDLPIKVFGTGDGIVSVHFLGETVTAKSENGKWCVSLSKRPFGGPYTMEIELNDDKIIINDILIGDVFLACGQSNMEMPLFRTESGFEDSLHCDNDNIRYYTVPRRLKKGVEDYGYHFEPLLSKEEPWVECNSESAIHFSAIGHYFAEYIQRKTNVPVGIISCNWGGRRIEAFIEKSYFYGVPSLESQMIEFENYMENLDMEEYEREFADYSLEYKNFLDERFPDDFGFARKVGVYSAVAKTSLAGQPMPPLGPYDGASPATLWETMFAEIVPFGVRALLWYQGESNGNDMDYCEKYLVFLKCIREQFDNEMDAYAVELAPFYRDHKDYNEFPMDHFVTEKNWAFLREQQQDATVKGKRNYLITTQELGSLYDIHPIRKKELAQRLAKKVLHHTYGFDIAADQPVYRSVEFRDGKAYITLDNSDGLYGFTYNVNMYIAGGDCVLHPATVEILPDNRLCVYSEEVEEPVLVRYGFGMYYFGRHLYNEAGLPLAPFRTDR